MNLKACNRCGGDMILEDLLDEAELVCLQCGHRTFAPGQPESRYQIIRRTRKPSPVTRAA
ncbi:MAG TPA: hypothetical protein VMR52_02295 [Dehalococcoidia bacterium]|nr:hypothetical protein [Dehalococcoidia bacterium]